MAADSKIEWTDATWNVLAGCEDISPGCAHCYAATMTRRLEAMGQADYSGLTTAKHFNGVLRTLPHKLDIPLQRRKPVRFFVNSMSDLFHESVPDEFIRRVFAVMSFAGQHTFQVLTKRAKRMQEWFANDENCLSACQAEYAVQHDYPRTPTGRDRIRNGRAINGAHKRLGDGNYWPLPNVWLGVSCERQQEADERIPWLLKTPAAVRFLSCEPLLGPIVLPKTVDRCPNCGKPPNACGLRDSTSEPFKYFCSRPSCGDQYPLPSIDWVIVGGESGPGARPMHPDWARSLRDQCQAAGVPFFFKQWGEFEPAENFWSCQADGETILAELSALKSKRQLKYWDSNGQVVTSYPWVVYDASELWDVRESVMARVGKHAAGRLLDGREWNEFPHVEAAHA